MDGVINSITPGMVLKSYLEIYTDLQFDWSKKSFCSHDGELLRTHENGHSFFFWLSIIPFI